MKRLFYTLDIEGNIEEIESRMKLQFEVRDKIKESIIPIIKEYITIADRTDLDYLIHTECSLLCSEYQMRAMINLRIKNEKSND